MSTAPEYAGGFNPDDPEVRADPFPAYTWLRDHAPAYKLPGLPMWAVSRFDDVNRVLRDHRTFSSDMGMEIPMMSLVLKDAPDHDRLRQAVNRAFSPARVQRLAPRIEAIAEELLTRAGGSCDLVDAFASPLPVRVIGEMLGIPVERRRDLRRWSRAALLASVSAAGIADPAQVARENRGLREFMEYLTEVIARHRVEPCDDVISTLLTLEDEGLLSADEVRYFCGLLFIGGHETTTNLIGNGAHILARDPALWQRLQTEPELVPGFVSEVLRYRSPLQRIVRRATCDVEIAGTVIPANSLIMLLLGAANRDPQRWPDPDRFDVERDSSRQLAFGAGAHFCLGAALSLLEGKIAFDVMLRRLRGLQLNPAGKALPMSSWSSAPLGWEVLPLILDVKPA
jgi:cytochrome P450